jgi:hypothetical protein
MLPKKLAITEKLSVVLDIPLDVVLINRFKTVPELLY